MESFPSHAARQPVAPPGVSPDIPHLLAELQLARREITRLEDELHFFRTHADNLDRGIVRSKRMARRAALQPPTAAPAAAPPAAAPPSGPTDAAEIWKQRYEEVVGSVSWRLVWWLATPYRVLLGARSARKKRRAGADRAL